MQNTQWIPTSNQAIMSLPRCRSWSSAGRRLCEEINRRTPWWMLRWDMKVAGEIRMWTGNICSFTEDITKYIRMMIIADISKDIRKVQALKSRGLRQALGLSAWRNTSMGHEPGAHRVWLALGATSAFTMKKISYSQPSQCYDSLI